MSKDIFNDILGQDKVLSLLISALANGTTTHAYLFTGTQGVGKTMAAVRFAAALNCEAKGCGVCQPCRKTLAGAHPDVEVIAADGASLKIEQVRKLGRSIGLKPFEGRRKAYIIRDAHLMTIEAANALLKNLEEPPGYVTFILTAPGADGLLPTVVSRCQEVPFAAIKPALIERLLIDQNGLAADKAIVIAALASGSVAKAKRLADDEKMVGLREFVLRSAGVLKEGDITALFRFKDEVMGLLKGRGKAEGPAAIVEVVEVLASWYRDLLVFKETGDPSLLINRDYTADVATESASYGRKDLTAALEVLVEAAKDMRTNANKELLLEYALLNVSGA